MCFKFRYFMFVLAILGMLLPLSAALSQGNRVSQSVTTGLESLKVFKGTISKNLKIWMKLRREGEKVSGTYFYESCGIDLTLDGNIDKSGNLTLNEFSPEGERTGVFKGRFIDTWSKPDKKPLPVKLTEVAMDNRAERPEITRKLKEESHKPKFLGDMAIPVLVGLRDPYVQAKFNSYVQWLINDWIKEDFPDQEDPNLLSDMESSLDIDYSVTLLNQKLISLGFVSIFYPGAHPAYRILTLNYELNSGRFLQLADLFKPNTDYLKRISNYCIADLKEQLVADTDTWIRGGASPEAENFQNFNITEEHLVIHFKHYQVASYAEGMQEVEIPYSVLREVLNPKSVIGSFIR